MPRCPCSQQNHSLWYEAWKCATQTTRKERYQGKTSSHNPIYNQLSSFHSLFCSHWVAALLEKIGLRSKSCSYFTSTIILPTSQGGHYILQIKNPIYHFNILSFPYYYCRVMYLLVQRPILLSCPKVPADDFYYSLRKPNYYYYFTWNWEYLLKSLLTKQNKILGKSIG